MKKYADVKAFPLNFVSYSITCFSQAYYAWGCDRELFYKLQGTFGNKSY